MATTTDTTGRQPTYPQHGNLPYDNCAPKSSVHAQNVARMASSGEITGKSEAARILGSSTSAKKAQASHANGALGGRPKGS